ncbi:MAG: hypothetical protein QW597_04340 [Thermoplasmataceae archaeon]
MDLLNFEWVCKRMWPFSPMKETGAFCKAQGVEKPWLIRYSISNAVAEGINKKIRTAFKRQHGLEDGWMENSMLASTSLTSMFRFTTNSL